MSATTTTTTRRPTVKLSQGTLLGSDHNDGFPSTVEQFLGVPYALPPIGPLRFKRPVPVPDSPNAVFEATKWAPRCPQKSFLVGAQPEPESEDCLYLNVFRPKGYDETKKLPVAVYIHGGAFNRGSSKMHESASMVGWSEEPFIVVSFNYRIGAYGFLPSEASAKEGVVNLGLRDQVMVLEWVQKNIGAFGGDAGSVTLFGLSAGAHSIAHHTMNINEPRELFHRVIIESGAATSRACHPYNHPTHEAQFKQFINLIGVPESHQKEGLFEYLRTVPAEKISAASIAVFQNYNKSLRWAFQPCIDGDIISRRPIDAWRSGKWHKVPIITGFSTNEGSMYVDKSMSGGENFTAFFKELLPKLNEEDLETINTLFLDPATDPQKTYLEDRADVGDQFRRVERAYATYAYSSPVRHTAYFASNDQSCPVYLYHWASRSSVINGANHGDNMWYEFHDKKLVAISDAHKELVGTFHAYWTSFIVSGSPNGILGRWRERPEWKPYEQESPVKIVFGEGNDERAGGNSVGVSAQMTDDSWMKKEADFWWSRTPSE